jgi:ABC-type lipoprotein release transport system permease subunit
LYAVEPQRERALSTLPDDVSRGRYLNAEDEAAAVLGWKLAENLGVGLGDEVVLMGTTRDHGAVFFLVSVVGLLDVVADPLDETLMLIPLRLYQQEMGLEGRSHQIVLKVQDINDAPRLADDFARRFLDGTDDVALSWRQLIPDVVDMMQFKLNSMFAVFGLLALMVSLSIGNTFMMTIFERTPEFGMLMAVGMRPHFIIGMLQVEALIMCVIGLLAGFVLSLVVLLAGRNGIPVNNEMAEVLAQLAGPDRLVPELQAWMLVVPAMFMVVATQLASLIPGLRLRHLQPVEALAEAV